MRKLILALFVCLIPHALSAQTVNPTSPAPVQDSSKAQAELEEAAKLSESVAQLYAAGKYKEALPLAERVLALCEKVRGEEDPLVGNALNNLAVIYIALKDFGKAEPILERVLARREKLKTATTPMTASLLISYACLLSGKGVSKREQVLKLVGRINTILFQDAVRAAGLPLPDKSSEASGGNLVSLKRTPPRYPSQAVSSRLQGVVLIWGEVDETGKVVSAEPVPCWSGQKPLADAAAEALRSARYKPMLIDGKFIKWKHLTTYSFVLEF
jgi:TonB family protein